MTKTSEPILAVIDNVIRLRWDTLGSDFVCDIQQELTRQNPQHQMIQRMMERNPKKYQYANMPARTIQSYFIDSETIYVPRGCKSLIKYLADKYKRTVKWHDERVFFNRDPGMSMVDGFELLPYQRNNIADPIIQECGIIGMPCGGGKTVLGIAIAMTLAQPTLILVHTNDLLAQWLGELRSKAVVPGGLGQWGGGKKVRGQVTVGTIQTIVRMPSAAKREFLSQFGTIMLDECHHCPADTFLGTMNLSPARFRYGFTATNTRKDGLQFLMFDTIGPMAAAINDDDLQDAGRSQDVSVVEVNTTFYTHHTADEWTNLINAIATDEDRNSLIVARVVESWNKGHFPLVLSDRVGHCKELCRRLQQNGMNARLLVGSVPKDQRNQIIDAARNNLVDAIVATKVADEGLDIPDLSCLHLTMPVSDRNRLQQMTGRIRRPVKGKESVVYDYIDTRVPTCKRRAQERRRHYRHWGFNYA